MKLKLNLPSFLKKKEKEPGEGIKPKGVSHTVIPPGYLSNWKYNDLAEVHSKKTILI